MENILQTIFTLFEVILLFNAIIIVHELGHFWAARWRGLHVEEFGVWFGKPIWKKKINGVIYSLGSIPAGGFVKLPQLAPMDAIEGKSEVDREELPPIKPLDKIIVAFAGPLFSMLLAIALACVVWGVGKPVSSVESTTTIGYVAPDSPAEKAGLLPGDRILEVDGHKVTRFSALSDGVLWSIIRSEGDTIPFVVERNGQTVKVESGFTKDENGTFRRAGLRKVGIAPAMDTRIEKVEPNSPAAEVGLQPNDRVTHVNGTPIFVPWLLSKTISDNPGAPVHLTVLRGDQTLNFTLVPKVLGRDAQDNVPRIGIQWHPGDYTLTYPTPWEQIQSSVTTISNMVGALFSPKSDVKAEHFSGPVGIFRLFFNMLSSDYGWRLALWFSVFFNVNLAILNMLPLPVLDGGHIVLATLEAIRRRPISGRLLEVVQTCCALLLFGYMIYVTFFDVMDIVPKGSAREPQAQPTADPAKTVEPATR